jgi:enamine deaminase RidA (YjgF/YER057c/UK114 family)
MWNHVPDIQADLGMQLDRYMVFNAGRHQAFREWFGGGQQFADAVPTASGVGCDGSSLVVHTLAAASPGTAIDNPRQVAPIRYSSRYGPCPPCFARATAWCDASGRQLVLIGGTASVRGEHSVHVGDLPAQLEETRANLEALIEEASRMIGRRCNLACLRSLRAYVPHDSDAGRVAQAMSAVFPNVTECELVFAALCRRDLLVEIEGVAVAG